MGFFDFFKRKKKQSTFPENELEKTLLEAVTDMKARERFYVKLLWNELYVITDGSNYVQEGSYTLEKDTSINFLTFDNGFIPIFTATNRIFDNNIIKKEVPFVAMKGQDLFAFTKGANFILNPYSEYQKELLHTEIEMLLNGTLFQEEPYIYVGKDTNLNAAQVELFNEKYELATSQIEGLIHTDGYRRRGISRQEKERIALAINSFNECLAIHPKHWQSIFFKAKAHQRLRNHEEAFNLLEKAFQIETENHIIPMEASLEAMHLQETAKALFYSAEAIKRKPDDVEVLGNHAMNLLILKKDDEATSIIDQALILAPNDNVLKKIKSTIDKVISGKQKRPTFEEAIR